MLSNPSRKYSAASPPDAIMTSRIDTDTATAFVARIRNLSNIAPASSRAVSQSLEEYARLVSVDQASFFLRAGLYEAAVELIHDSRRTSPKGVESNGLPVWFNFVSGLFKFMTTASNRLKDSSSILSDKQLDVVFGVLAQNSVLASPQSKMLNFRTYLRFLLGNELDKYSLYESKIPPGTLLLLGLLWCTPDPEIKLNFLIKSSMHVSAAVSARILSRRGLQGTGLTNESIQMTVDSYLQRTDCAIRTRAIVAAVCTHAAHHAVTYASTTPVDPQFIEYFLSTHTRTFIEFFPPFHGLDQTTESELLRFRDVSLAVWRHVSLHAMYLNRGPQRGMFSDSLFATMPSFLRHSIRCWTRYPDAPKDSNSVVLECLHTLPGVLTLCVDRPEARAPLWRITVEELSLANYTTVIAIPDIHALFDAVKASHAQGIKTLIAILQKFAELLCILSGSPCARSMCTNHSTESLAVCAGCGVMRYCGVECQRSDWLAHKRTCNKQRLGDKLDRSSSFHKLLHMGWLKRNFNQVRQTGGNAALLKELEYQVRNVRVSTQSM